jgi:ribosome-associated protein
MHHAEREEYFEEIGSVHPFELQGDHITLAHAIKAVGVAATGGQAKTMVREGMVKVNGKNEVRPGRKLVAKDRFAIGDEEWILQ